ERHAPEIVLQARHTAFFVQFLTQGEGLLVEGPGARDVPFGACQVSELVQRDRQAGAVPSVVPQANALLQQPPGGGPVAPPGPRRPPGVLSAGKGAPPTTRDPRRDSRGGASTRPESRPGAGPDPGE